jgi:hypothetical protein
MKTAAVVIAMAAAILGSACANVSPLPAGGGPPSVAAPDIRIGDRWTFEERNGYNQERTGSLQQEVVATTGPQLRVSVNNNGKSTTEAYTRDWNWLSKNLKIAPGEQRFDFKTAFPAYMFPLQPDQGWFIDVAASNAGGRSVPFKVRTKVLGWQRIRVPAGDFDALLIRREVWMGDEDMFRTGTEIVEYDWYAPKVNNVVRHEENSKYYSKTSTNGHLSAAVIRGDWRIYELTAYDNRGGGQ